MGWEPIGPFAGGGWQISPGENDRPFYVPNDDGKAEANARLIAAAPDLLAACELAVTALSSARFDTAAYDPHVTKLLAAIAKAKGGA